jgi:phospholipid/cholesterol/gamma-HCH transport system substrate-binding protein
VISRHLPGIRQILVTYPYQVAGGFTVVAKNPDGYNARFGFVLNPIPAVCEEGYDVNERRSPTDGSNKPMDMDAQCTAAITKTNARGAQNAPRAATTLTGDPVATYDVATKKLTWSDQETAGNVVYDGGAERVYGADSWKSLLLQPLS